MRDQSESAAGSAMGRGHTFPSSGSKTADASFAEGKMCLAAAQGLLSLEAGVSAASSHVVNGKHECYGSLSLI